MVDNFEKIVSSEALMLIVRFSFEMTWQNVMQKLNLGAQFESHLYEVI